MFETCFQRTRKGERPWLVPLVVVVLFAIGMIAAATHVHSLSRAFASIGAGTVNFGSGMVKEVLLAGIFFILALIDLIITFVKKDSPFALRVIGAIAAVLVIVLMLLTRAKKKKSAARRAEHEWDDWDAQDDDFTDSGAGEKAASGVGGKEE